MLFYGPTRSSFDTGAKIAAQSASAQAREARTEVEALRFDIERLLMITEALWNFIKEQHQFTDEELLAKITEIDMRDGKLDGRVKKSSIVKCPNCGRVLMKNRPVCLYCGTAVALDPFHR